MKILDAPQRSPEWFAARIGRLTGSKAKDMLATIKTGEAAARRDYRTQLVVERITGQRAEEGFVSGPMLRGVELEPNAIAAYEAHTGLMVRSTGFIQHEILAAGCSVDGEVGDFEGIIEIKCPKSATHLRYLNSPGKTPSEHRAQILHNLWITGAQWCDFVSYDDRFPEGLQLVVHRVEYGPDDLLEYEAKVIEFLAEVDAETEQLTARLQRAATAKE